MFKNSRLNLKTRKLKANGKGLNTKVKSNATLAVFSIQPSNTLATRHAYLSVAFSLKLFSRADSFFSSSLHMRCHSVNAAVWWRAVAGGKTFRQACIDRERTLLKETIR